MGDSHPAAIAGRTAPPEAAPQQPANPVPGNATSLTTGSTTPSEGASYLADLKD